MNIHPIPEGKGSGFTSSEPLPDASVHGYDYLPVGRYHNYHFTATNYLWPVEVSTPTNLIIDGFSPNLNKLLHVGHLRNLALSKSLSSILTGSKFVAFLGCSLGIKEGAEKELWGWFDFLNYHPEIHRDTDVCAKHPVEGVQGEGEYVGCIIWPGKKHPVVLRRSDGRTTYAYHDLSFVKAVGPTHYITGSEQFEHFANLGLEEKHLPMGLVLDPKTGKKMKSRDGNALDAAAALQLVIDRLQETPHAKELAWNILAWNFLRVNRSKDVAFDVEQWTGPEAPGLYVTYTLARLLSALEDLHIPFSTEYSSDDVMLLGECQYLNYYLQKAINTLDPSPIANYAHTLAKKLNLAYHRERINGGRVAFQNVIAFSVATLTRCIKLLGMFPLTRV